MATAENPVIRDALNTARYMSAGNRMPPTPQQPMSPQRSYVQPNGQTAMDPYHPIPAEPYTNITAGMGPAGAFPLLGARSQYAHVINVPYVPMPTMGMIARPDPNMMAPFWNFLGQLMGKGAGTNGGGGGVRTTTSNKDTNKTENPSYSKDRRRGAFNHRPSENQSQSQQESSSTGNVDLSVGLGVAPYASEEASSWHMPHPLDALRDWSRERYGYNKPAQAPVPTQTPVQAPASAYSLTIPATQPTLRSASSLSEQYYGNLPYATIRR